MKNKFRCFIPEKLLPVLYYAEDGKYMLLATAKNNRIQKEKYEPYEYQICGYK